MVQLTVHANKKMIERLFDVADKILDNNRLFIPCGNMSSNNDVLLFYGAVSKLTNDFI